MTVAAEMLAAMATATTAAASTMVVTAGVMTTMTMTTMAAAAGVAADDAVGTIKICGLKLAIYFTLLHSSTYSCGGGSTPKLSARTITHGVGMTPMHWVGVSLHHRQW